MKKRSGALSTAVVAGLALFAVFFGAGNLIFPPFLGHEAGTGWLKGFLCFVTADAGLAIMTVLTTVNSEGTMDEMLSPLGRIPARVLATALVLCVGPLVAIPRTGATTYELGAKALLPDCNSWVFSFIFFGIVALLTIRPTAVMDIIGKFLTPLLLITLAVLCLKGIFSPLGGVKPEPADFNVAKEGFLSGYQTMDALGAIPLTIMLLKSVSGKGFAGRKEQMKVMIPGSLIAFAGLFAVYGGLCYLGATTSMMELDGINQTGLVVLITEMLLKRFGVVLLGLIVLFACLTTAIGLTSSAADYFTALFKGKISYKAMVLIICGMAVAISNVGISSIIRLASPVLTVIYPIFLTQIVLVFFGQKISNHHIHRGAAIGAMLIAVLDTAAGLGLSMPFLHSLPLASYGFSWLLPAVLGGMIGGLIPQRPAEKKQAASAARSLKMN